jgi:HK97 family phage major capsid protein
MVAKVPKNEDFSVLRDYTVSREFLDQVRAVLPACHICNKPSGFKDMEGRWSHQVCAGESSSEKREAKAALIRTRGRNVASDAGPVDLGVVMRKVEEQSAGPRAVVEREKSPAERHAETMRHIRATDPPPARRSAELISRMSERDVFDLSRVRVDPMDRNALRGELIDRARRANDLAHYPTAGRDQERVQDHIDNLLRRSDSEQWNGREVAERILTTGSPAYKTAFAKIIVDQIRMGMGAMLTPEEAQAVKLVTQARAMAVGVGSTGGFAVPFQLDSTIVPTSSGSRNPLRQICRVESISGTNEWRSATSGQMVAAYATEALTASDNSPTLAQKTLTTVRAQAFAPVSIELSSDWSGIQDQLGALILSARDDLEAAKFTLGTGTNEPEGILVGATTTTATAGVATFALGDLYKLEESVPGRFRAGAQWIANKIIWNKAAQFANTGADIWAPALQAGKVSNTGYAILNYPANELTSMVSTTTTASKIIAAFDPSYYVIADRIGLDLEVTSYHYQQTTMGVGSGFPLGQRGILALWRNSAKLLDPNAARVLQVA